MTLKESNRLYFKTTFEDNNEVKILIKFDKILEKYEQKKPSQYKQCSNMHIYLLPQYLRILLDLQLLL